MILFLASILSDNISVTVNVTSADGVQLKKVSVTPLLNGEESAIDPQDTDENGYAVFLLSAGNYTFSAHDALGLYDNITTKSVEISEGFTDSVNIEMKATPNAAITVEFTLTLSPVDKCKGVEVVFWTSNNSATNVKEEVKQEECVFTIQGTADKDSFIKRYDDYSVFARLDGYKDVT